ncbi:MAG: C4-dicarboxylate TRAP transporter substrate-binding protein [Rhodospirillaceae bacterium]
MTGKISRRTLLGTGAAACVGMALGRPARPKASAPVIALDGYPAKAMWVKEMSGFLLPEINKNLAEIGADPFVWQEEYGGSVVKPRGVLEGMRQGKGDLGVVTTIFHASKLPSQAIAAVTPFVSSDARIVAKAVDEIAQEFPDMAEEFAAQGQVYLTTGVVLNSYQVFSKVPVAGIADLSGLKIAGAGYNLRYLEGVRGASGQRGGLTKFTEMITAGKADAAMLWAEAARTFGVAEVAPHMLRANLGAVNTKTLTANAAFWDGLSPEIQGAIRKAALAYRDRLAEEAMRRAAVAEQAFLEGGGTIVDLSQADREAWAEAMPNIAKLWAGSLDIQGKNGTAMLKAYMAKLEAADAKPARNWAV